jgi:hypothetical protein
VRVRALTQSGEEPLVRRHVPALAEHRFDEERRGVGRRTQGLQHVVELTEREVGRLLDRPAEVAGVGERRDVDAGHQRAEPGPELGPRRGHRGRRDRPAVEAAVEHDHVRPPGRLPGQPERGLDRLAAGIREEHPVEMLGEDLAEPVDQRQQRSVHDSRVLRVDDLADLFLGGRDDARMAVPGRGHPDPGGEVEVPAVLLVEQLDALTAGGDDSGRLLQDLRELGHKASLPFVDW